MGDISNHEYKKPEKRQGRASRTNGGLNWKQKILMFMGPAALVTLEGVNAAPIPGSDLALGTRGLNQPSDHPPITVPAASLDVGPVANQPPSSSDALSVIKHIISSDTSYTFDKRGEARESHVVEESELRTIIQGLEREFAKRPKAREALQKLAEDTKTKDAISKLWKHPDFIKTALSELKRDDKVMMSSIKLLEKLGNIDRRDTDSDKTSVEPTVLYYGLLGGLVISCLVFWGCTEFCCKQGPHQQAAIPLHNIGHHPQTQNTDGAQGTPQNTGGAQGTPLAHPPLAYQP